MYTYVHGGDVYTASGKKNLADYSANINPLGLPQSVKKAIVKSIAGCADYPDPFCRRLTEKLAGFLAVPGEYIFFSNGAADVLFKLALALRPKKALLLAPTFADYEKSLRSVGCRIDYYLLREENNFEPQSDILRQLTPDIDFVVICNPNNPTSSAISINDLRRIVSFCNERNIFVMIDETYVEFAPDIKAITAVPLTREFTNLMVLRGVSKFFAAPGMRLGYGITGNMDFLSKMREKQTPWSLNSLGAFAGEIMLQDEDYIKETRNLILSERDRMIQELKNVDTYKVYPAYANFILLKIQKDGLTSYEVFEACIKQGLMIRDCSSFQCLDGEFVRFCIMMPEDNGRLLEVLKTL